jgi:spectinomycin phosphotransferase
MLDRPDLEEDRLVACLRDAYGLPAAQISFMPLGADRNTAVYRAITSDGAAYFMKLRAGDFDETSVALPKFLNDQGIPQIIAPLTTRTGALCADLNPFKVILSPFIEGRNGYQVDLSDRHWRDFGAAMKRIHDSVLPPALLSCIRSETYTPRWREQARAYLSGAPDFASDDLLAERLAAFLSANRDLILDLVVRAGRLAQVLRAGPTEPILCHSDIHAGNILIDANDALYIVDWDDPILAPKERDLMYIGGAQGFAGHTAQEEEVLFYQGYGPTQVDPVALAYYRFERIVQDIALFCDQILASHQGGEDRERAFGYLVSNFLPNGTIDMAHRSDRTLR